MLRVSPDASCDFGERGCVLHSNVDYTYNKPRLDASLMSDIARRLSAHRRRRSAGSPCVPCAPTCLNSANVFAPHPHPRLSAVILVSCSVRQQNRGGGRND